MNQLSGQRFNVFPNRLRQFDACSVLTGYDIDYKRGLQLKNNLKSGFNEQISGNLL